VHPEEKTGSPFTLMEKEYGNPELPSIAYHRISIAVTNGMTVTPDLFRRHMQFLADNHYSPITLDQWCAAVSGNGKLPEKPILITFDDAWKSQYENALPILNEFGYKATFYAYINVIGNRSTMTWNQLRNLAFQGHNVGCHSATHDNLVKLLKNENTEKYNARIYGETLYARIQIEEHIGFPVRHFCYPYGYYNTNLIAKLKKAGFISAVTVNPSPNTTDTPLFKLGRYIIAPWTNEKQFRDTLTLLPLDVKNVKPFDGEICEKPTEKFSVVVPGGNHPRLTNYTMYWEWKKTSSFWNDDTRVLSHSFDKTVEPGIYTAQVHAWDADSNHYTYAWLFQQL